MILDDKLISLCDRVCKQFDNEYFVFYYFEDRVVIKCINRGHFSILSLVIDKGELKDYPKYCGLYVMDVKTRSLFNDEDAELILDSYEEFSSELPEEIIKLVGTFDKPMYNTNDYIRYPFDVFNNTLTRLHKKMSGESMRIEVSYKKYTSHFSVDSLKKLVIGEDAKSIWLKLIGTDMPLYLNYKVVVDGLNVNVYGVHAPLIDVVSDEKVRVI